MRAILPALLLTAAAPSLAAQAVPCLGQRIDTIVVTTEAPTVTGLRRVPMVGAVVRKTHVVTRGEIVRGFLLLEQGDRCVELRRAESERILRAQPFIADASVDVYPSRAGGVRLVVTTIDEASVIVGGSVAGSTPNIRSAKLGSTNLAGVGITTSFAWRYEPFYDDQYEGRFIDHQLFGQPYVLDLFTSRKPFTRDNRAQFSLPFRTSLQRFAWRGLAGESRSHAAFEQRDTGFVGLGVSRDYGEAGGIVRIGPPQWLTLVGASFTSERAVPDTAPSRLSEFFTRPDTAALLTGRFRESRSSRINALIGVRGLRFRRAAGIDALRGVQDIPMGVQLGTLVGRGIHAFGATAEDLFVASDLYMGFGNSTVVYRFQAQAEGRRDPGTRTWDGLVGSGRLSRHERVNGDRTRKVSVEWSGTSRVLVPHALSFGAPDGGLRGYRDATEIGGRRAVVRVDEQFYLGSPNRFGDLGIVAFADAGKLWRGDIPYAETTPVRASAGIGLLLAVPMRSTRMWRLEFAVPVTRSASAGTWELRLSSADLTTFFWREPADVDAARARAVPASIYSWP